MNIKVSQHKAICEMLSKTYEAKNHDYSDSFSKIYKEFGLLSSAIRLQDKLERFKNLASERLHRQVKDESIEDTLLDMANYAIMTVIEMNADKPIVASGGNENE